MSPSPAAQPVLPDEVLEDIFLLLEDAADLARASAACTCFRRVVSGCRFLRRYRSLHPPPILGILDFSSRYRGFHPAQSPRRSAPAAGAFAEAADFNLSFLPKDPSRCWHVRDLRDGRFLLSQHTRITMFLSKDLIVCDPLHRRYVQIPPVPGGLGLCGKEVIIEPFLAPVISQEKDEPPSIQVICNVISEYELTITTFVFSSVTGKWRYAASFSIANHEWMKCPLMATRRYVHNCFYWVENRFSVEPMLVLDICAMKFSAVELPQM
ncbi:hypothetical protein QOZ80_5BG0446170 [Eleusine coracana subsp. coracana]|nr:hypothetical protein QOZ80_5BG0446170 [Eleusine coracana subsp. coracana]